MQQVVHLFICLFLILIWYPVYSKSPSGPVLRRSRCGANHRCTLWLRSTSTTLPTPTSFWTSLRPAKSAKSRFSTSWVRTSTCKYINGAVDYKRDDIYIFIVCKITRRGYVNLNTKSEKNIYFFFLLLWGRFVLHTPLPVSYLIHICMDYRPYNLVGFYVFANTSSSRKHGFVFSFMNDHSCLST